jgi:ATP-dependent helicase/DNAse subunit B
MAELQVLYGDELAPLVQLVQNARKSSKKLLVILPSFISIENCQNALLDQLDTIDNVVFERFDDLALRVIEAGSATFVDLLDDQIEREAVSRGLRDSKLYSEGLRNIPQFISYMTNSLGELRRSAAVVTSDICELPKGLDDSKLLEALTDLEKKTYQKRLAESRQLITAQWNTLQPVFKSRYYPRELAVAEATRILGENKDAGLEDIAQIYIAYIFHVDDVLARFILLLAKSRPTSIWMAQDEKYDHLSHRFSELEVKKIKNSRKIASFETPRACPDPRREILTIARDAYKQIVEGNLKPSEMLVVARDSGEYEDIFYEVMEEFGIPAEAQTRQYFRVLAAAHFYKSLLEFAATDGRSMGEAAIEILETGYPGVSGYSMFWMRRLIHRLGMSYDSVLSDLKGRTGTELLGGWTVDWWIKLLEGLFSIREELRKATTAEEILDILVDSEAKLGVVENASRRLQDHEALSVPRGIRAKELEGTLKLLKRLWRVRELSKLTSEVLGSEKITLDQFKDLFDEFLETETYGTSHQSREVLQFIDAGNIDFRHPKRLYLVGMGEGTFPSKVRETAFLGDAISKKLTDDRVCYLQNTTTSLNYEKWIFVNCMASSPGSTSISYSYLDSAGHPRLYSPFLLSEGYYDPETLDKVIADRMIVDSFAPTGPMPTAKRDTLRYLAGTIGTRASGTENVELTFDESSMKVEFDALTSQTSRLVTPPPAAVIPKRPSAGSAEMEIDSLNEYAACQFRYYSRYVLRLQPGDFRPCLRLRRFYWEILESLFPRLSKLNLVQLQTAVKAELQNKIKSEDVPNPRLMRRLERIVFAYLASEKDRYQSTRFPLDSRQIEFGRSVRFSVNGLTFVGTLDRVDTLRDGSVVVYEIRESAEDVEDSFPSLETYGGGQLADFKLPLVLEALRQEGKRVVGFEFQCLRAPRARRLPRQRGVVLSRYASGLAAANSSTQVEEEVFERSISTWLNSAVSFARTVAGSTRFRVDPHPVTLCDNCSFSSLCLGPGGLPP